MIGDIISIKPHHLPPARKIVECIKPELQKSDCAFAVTVGGESGSGKSTLSLAVQKVLQEMDYSVFIFHMDDYFKLPPKDNHDRRMEDISHIGSDEVNLDLLQKHIDQSKKGIKKLKKPLVHYRENQIREVIVEMKDIDVVIAEGTYVSMLDRIDCKVFLQRDYQDTYQSRVERARDPIIPFNEKVLKIEHEIVSKHAEQADILVDKKYKVAVQSDRFGGISS